MNWYVFTGWLRDFWHYMARYGKGIFFSLLIINFARCSITVYQTDISKIKQLGIEPIEAELNITMMSKEEVCLRQLEDLKAKQKVLDAQKTVEAVRVLESLTTDTLKPHEKERWNSLMTVLHVRELDSSYPLFLKERER